jgi:Tat protein translocase TatB subunit
VFNVGPEKILLILLIALIVLGPNELPDMARKVGRVMSELRGMSAGFHDEVRADLDAITAEPPPTAWVFGSLASRHSPTFRSEADPT